MNNLFQTFNILEHINKLTPAKEKGRYICPVCDGNNLTVSKDGAYQCWNGCDCKDIREAIAPFHIDRTARLSPAKPIKRFKAKPKPAIPIPATESIQLAILSRPVIDSPLPEKQTDKEHGEVWVTTYQYSTSQWVKRIEWVDGSKPKGHNKTFQQWHRDASGKEICKKGFSPWRAYRIDEALAALVATENPAALLHVEGEKCVEIARAHGIAAATFQGSNWDSASLKRHFAQLKNKHPSAIAVLLKDNDTTGQDKAEAFEQAAEEAGVLSVVIDPVAIYPEIPDKGDIEEILATMEHPEFIKRLEAGIHATLAARIEEQRLNDPDERLRLALLDLLAETDSIKRLRKRAEICSNYRLSKGEVESAVKELKQQTTTAKPLVFPVDEFLSQSSEAMEFVVPGMLPMSETALLIGTAGCGKTLLAIDLAFAAATGEADFLGETVRQGRVLLISADESPNSTRAKLLKRGFRLEDADRLRVMPSFDMTQLSVLEQQLEDFRPMLVIIDSLRRINHGGDISENSAEFADSLYTLKELLQRYKAAGLIIHQCGKSKEAVGVDKARGSGAIVGAVWGVWTLEQIVKMEKVEGINKPVINPSDPKRIFSIPKARDCEGQTLNVELDPEYLHWINHGNGEGPEVLAERRTRQQKILDLLRQYAPIGLEGSQIRELLGVDKSIYSELNRMVAKRLITQRPSQKDKRRTVYALPDSGGDSPPPTPYVPNAIQSNEAYTEQCLQDGSQMERKRSANGSQGLCDLSDAIQSDPSSTSVSEMDRSLETHRGGEGVSPAAIHSASETRNDIQPNSAKKIEQQIKVGSRVKKRHNIGWSGVVKEISEDKAKVLWHGDTYPVSISLKELKIHGEV